METLATNPERNRLRSLVEEIGKIRFDRSPTAIAQDPEYVRNINRIKLLYRNVQCWHGTGRYKYSHDGNVYDVLQGIIHEGGLKPHEDDWDRKRGTIQTISFASSRMYARSYASMHCPNETHIKNELGTRELWGYYFFGTSGIVGMFEYPPDIRAVLKGDKSTTLIPDMGRKTKEWGAKITKSQPNFKEIFIRGTDIPNNYPILIGIRKDTVSPTSNSRFINLHEIRTEEGIALIDINHIEVPQDNVSEATHLLQEAGYPNVPVLPIEYGEEFCRNFPFRKLVSGKPLVLKN